MLRLIQPNKSKIPVSGVFFTTDSFSPHLMLSTIQTQFLSNRMIIFSAFTKCLHTYTKLSIQSISISKYNPYSTWTKSRHEELGCLTLTRTTGQTIQPLDNTHERHQISTTGVTSAVQPIGTNGLKKAEITTHKWCTLSNQARPKVSKLLANISDCSIVTYTSLTLQTEPQLLSVFVLSFKKQVWTQN